MTNPYFAYTLKQDFDPKAQPKPTHSEPVKTKKARACDACSIRKTKCDNGRPCRQCVNNNLECSELRQRKKPGPRSIRRKTINSINTLRKSSESPDNLILQVDFKNSSLPDLSLVMQELAQYSPDWFTSCVPYTTHAMAAEIPVLILSLTEDPVVSSSQSLHVYSKRYAVMTLLLTLLTLAKTPENDSRIDILIGAVQRHISCMSQVCNDFVFFEKSSCSPEVHYNLFLADLHMFSYMQLRSPQSTHNFVRLRSAASHYQVLCADRDENVVPLADIRYVLFLWERNAALFCASSAYRNSTLVVDSKDLTEQLALPVIGFRVAYHELLKAMDIAGLFKHDIPDLFAFDTEYANGYTDADFRRLSDTLQTCVQSNCQYLEKPTELAMYRLLGLIMRFKILLTCALEMPGASVYKETLEIVDGINSVLAGLHEVIIRPWLWKFSTVTQLLEMLEFFLRITSEMELESSAVDSIIQLSGYINLYLDKESEGWVKRPVISSWFQKLYLNEQ